MLKQKSPLHVQAGGPYQPSPSAGRAEGRLRNLIGTGIALIESNPEVRKVSLDKSLLDAPNMWEASTWEFLHQMALEAGLCLKRTVQQHRCGYLHELVLERVEKSAS